MRKPCLLVLLSPFAHNIFALAFRVGSIQWKGQNGSQGMQVRDPTKRRFLRDMFWAAVAAPNIVSIGGATNAAEAARQPRYETASDIPEEAIENHQILYGYVEQVIDGDTIRFRHVPDYMLWQGNDIGLSSIVNSNTPIGNTTIVVRLYGVDAPETAKKKTETSQPFGEEATQFTKDFVFHKVVTIKLLRRDKYRRIVAEVSTFASTTSPGIFSPPKDLSLELASRGLATIYTGKGSEYDVSTVHGRPVNPIRS
jgi:endonuclease YncB( thermonuclease family)